MLIVMVGGLVMMGRSGGPAGGVFGAFTLMWVVIGLAGAAMAFYNAFSEEGLPLYEVDVEANEDRSQDGAGTFCPRCGKRIDPDDAFCRHCGASLDAPPRA